MQKRERFSQSEAQLNSVLALKYSRFCLLITSDSNVFFQAGEAGEESSDSDGEQEETSHKLIRKVSTSGQIRAKVRKKEE